MPRLFGIELATCTMDEIVATLRKPPTGTQALPLFTLNVAHVASLRRSAAFRHAYRCAWLATIDGMPILVVARLKRLGLHRIAGADLVTALFATRVAGLRPFFVAGSEATASAIRDHLVARGFADADLAFVVPPFGFETDAAFSRALAGRVKAHGTTHLLMGVGAPKSEIWVVARKAELGGCYALCVGAGLDFLAGTKARAPAVLRETGLEWAWRLWSEPRRLARRYLVDAFAFAYIVAFRKLDLEKDERSAT